MQAAIILIVLAVAGIAAISVTLLREKRTVIEGNEKLKEQISTSGFSFKGEFDAIIFRNARAQGVDPVLVKSICAKESTFNPLAINPEKSGVSVNALRNEILGSPIGGNDVLKKFRVDPSIGIMQVRVTTARDFERDTLPVDLFKAETCIRIGSEFIAWLGKNGVPLPERIDAYNVGLGAFKKGKGSAAYRADVLRFMRQFANDFPLA